MLQYKSWPLSSVNYGEKSYAICKRKFQDMSNNFKNDVIPSVIKLNLRWYPANFCHNFGGRNLEGANIWEIFYLASHKRQAAWLNKYILAQESAVPLQCTCNKSLEHFCATFAFSLLMIITSQKKSS